MSKQQDYEAFYTENRFNETRRYNQLTETERQQVAADYHAEQAMRKKILAFQEEDDAKIVLDLPE